MKICFIIIFLFISIAASAQSKLIQQLDSIAATASGTPQIKHLFAKLYKNTTISIDEAMCRRVYTDTVIGPSYHDSNFIKILEDSFALLFYKAINTYPSKNLPQGWQLALNDSVTEKITTLQKLLLAINAHINDDLLQALLSANITDKPVERKQDLDEAAIRIFSVLNTTVVKFMQQFKHIPITDRLMFNYARKKMKRFVYKERNAIWQRFMIITAKPALKAAMLNKQEAVSKYYADIILHPPGAAKFFFKKIKRKYVLSEKVFFDKVL